MVESLLQLGLSLLGSVAKSNSLGSFEISLIMAWSMHINDRAVAMSWPANWSINKKQLGDVVLVNHTQHWFLLSLLLLWIDNFSLHGTSLGIGSIRWDEGRSVVLGDSLNSSQRLWKTCRIKTVDIWLDLTLLITVNIVETYDSSARVLNISLFLS